MLSFIKVSSWGCVVVFTPLCRRSRHVNTNANFVLKIKKTRSERSVGRAASLPYAKEKKEREKYILLAWEWYVTDGWYTSHITVFLFSLYVGRRSTKKKKTLNPRKTWNVFSVTSWWQKGFPYICYTRLIECFVEDFRVLVDGKICFVFFENKSRLVKAKSVLTGKWTVIVDAFSFGKMLSHSR